MRPTAPICWSAACRAWARWRVFGDERRAATRLDPEAFRFFRRRLLTRAAFFALFVLAPPLDLLLYQRETT